MKRLIKSAMVFIKKLQLDYVSAYAAQAAFFILLSLFPFAMLLYAIISHIPIVSNGNMGELFSGLVPNAFNSFLQSLFAEAAGGQGTVTVISVTAVTALWSSSKGVLSLIRGLNRVCSIEETRNYFAVRGIACLYTFGFVVGVVLAAVLVVFGKNISYTIISAFPAAEGVIRWIYSLRIVISLAVLVLLFTFLYRFLPNRKSTFKKEFLGAFAAASGWIGFSYIYSFYISNFARTSVYGSLTTVLLFMLWLYVCFYMFFVGAEINTFNNRDASVIEFIRQYHAARKSKYV